MDALLAVQRARHVVAGVADALQLAHLAHHQAYLGLRLVREVAVAHLLQVFGYLQFHVVRDALVLLNPAVGLGKLLHVFLLHQRGHHAEHALHALAEESDFLLGL